MSFNWSDYSPVDSTGRSRSVFTSYFRNIRYAQAIVYWKTITIRQSDISNLPGIADRYYGDVTIWHALMGYNGLIDPLVDLQPGVQLRLFTKASIISYLSQQQQPTSRRTFAI